MPQIKNMLAVRKNFQDFLYFTLHDLPGAQTRVTVEAKFAPRVLFGSVKALSGSAVQTCSTSGVFILIEQASCGPPVKETGSSGR